MLYDTYSNDFKRAVSDTHNICKKIGISKLTPNVLYKHIIDAYDLHEYEQFKKINILNGLQFID